MGSNHAKVPTKEQLEWFIANGIMQKDVAVLLGVSRSFVQDCEKHHGLSRKKMSRKIPINQQIGKLIALGLNYREIGERCNVSTSTAGTWVRIYKAESQPVEIRPVSVKVEFLADDHPLVRFMVESFNVNDL